jgi:hypothetical protein
MFRVQRVKAGMLLIPDGKSTPVSIRSSFAHVPRTGPTVEG